MKSKDLYIKFRIRNDEWDFSPGTIIWFKANRTGNNIYNFRHKLQKKEKNGCVYQLMEIPNICYILSPRPNINCHLNGELKGIGDVMDLVRLFTSKDKWCRKVYRRYKKLQTLEQIKAELFIDAI